jgi:hypothetical protein
MAMSSTGDDRSAVWGFAVFVLCGIYFIPWYLPFKRMMKSRYRETWCRLVFWGPIHVEYICFHRVLWFLLGSEYFGDADLRRAKHLARFGWVTFFMMAIGNVICWALGLYGRP